MQKDLRMYGMWELMKGTVRAADRKDHLNESYHGVSQRMIFLCHRFLLFSITRSAQIDPWRYGQINAYDLSILPDDVPCILLYEGYKCMHAVIQIKQ